jgi:hypothetical protein
MDSEPFSDDITYFVLQQSISTMNVTVTSTFHFGIIPKYCMDIWKLFASKWTKLQFLYKTESQKTYPKCFVNTQIRTWIAYWVVQGQKHKIKRKLLNQFELYSALFW